LGGPGAHAIPDRAVAYPNGASFLSPKLALCDFEFGNPHAANVTDIEWDAFVKK
jgi:hypothetical protein